ncbi:MAG: hypothetical protein JWO95_15 [Verrucomicrobiales bacterium]|nr:hypothetical protein [Verrucomicrobiales bacterium]
MPTKKTSAPRFQSVEDYLASLDATKAKTLKSVIDLIITEFPGLEAKISWNVPQIHRNGKYVFGLAALKNHLTLAPWSPAVMHQFHAMLAKKFVTNKHCFQIPVDWQLDRELLKKLVHARLAELD